MKRLLALVATMYLFSALAWMAISGPVAARPLQSFILYTSCLAVIYLIVFKLLRPGIHKGALFSPSGIIISGVLLRIMFLPYPLSDDVNRYAWEGHIQNRGINPYAVTPAQLGDSFKQDPVFINIRHKDLSTVHPPVALLVFRAVSGISYSLRTFKLFFILCDILTLMILAVLLREWQVSWQRLILYAWNPLVLLFGAGEGYLVVMNLLFIAVSLLLFSRVNRVQSPWLMSSLAYLVLGTAVLTGYAVLLILPFVITRRNRRFLPFILVPFLLYIPFRHPAIFRSVLPGFGTHAYTGFLPRLLHIGLSGMPFAAIMLCLLGAGIVIAWLFFQQTPLKGLMFAYLWFLLCLPHVQTWYLLPFALMMMRWPNRAVFLFCVTAGVNFWRVNQLLLTGSQPEIAWLWYAAYLPVLLILVYDWENTRLPWYPLYPRLRSIDIIIPVRAASDHIISLLGSLTESIAFARQACSYFPETVITIADGSGSQAAPAVARDFPVTVLQAPEGRDSPLNNAVNATRGDLILIISPDTVTRTSALLRVYGTLNRNPSAAWGILGCRYDVVSLKTLGIACINYLRFHLLGIALGIDGIFIHRRVLTALDGIFDITFPGDLDMSMQLQSFPHTSCSGMITIPAHQLESKNIVWRIFRSVPYMFTFLLCRRLGCTMSCQGSGSITINGGSSRSRAASE
jgi:hypothetical protein